MKKILFFALALGCIGLTSCKKDYTCTCTTTDNDPNFDYNATASITLNAKKKDAETTCNGYESTVSSGTYVVSTTCELK